MGVRASNLCFSPETAAASVASEVQCLNTETCMYLKEDIMIDVTATKQISVYSESIPGLDQFSDHIYSGAPPGIAGIDDAEVMGPHTLLWLNADEMEGSGSIIGTWTYDRGNFLIYRSCSKLIFGQHNFTGELLKDDQWLVVDIPQKNGSIRLQMDQSGKYLRSQFKRFESDKWCKATVSAKDGREVASIKNGYMPILPEDEANENPL